MSDDWASCSKSRGFVELAETFCRLHMGSGVVSPGAWHGERVRLPRVSGCMLATGLCSRVEKCIVTAIKTHTVAIWKRLFSTTYAVVYTGGSGSSMNRDPELLGPPRSPGPNFTQEKNTPHSVGGLHSTPLPRPGSRPLRSKATPPLSALQASSFSPWGPAEGPQVRRMYFYTPFNVKLLRQIA